MTSPRLVVTAPATPGTTRAAAALLTALLATLVGCLVIVGCLAIVAPASAAPPPPAPPASSAAADGLEVPPDDPVSLAVTAYALESTRPAVVRRDRRALSTLSVVGSLLLPSGDGLSRPSDRARALLATAHAQGLRADLLVSGWNGELGDFDPRALRRLLRDPSHRTTVVDRLVRLVRLQGWDGVNLDLERVAARDGRRLVDLVVELRGALPPSVAITVDVPARSSLTGYRDAGFRLAALAAAVDAVQLMAYDEHGPGWTGPGPVGSTAWATRCVDAALTALDPGRLDLGVAGYGYLWPGRRSTRTAGSVTVARARALVARDGTSARLDEESDEWTATLADGTVLWWSDATTLVRRAAVARDAGLRGLAVWRLGSAGRLPVLAR